MSHAYTLQFIHRLNSDGTTDSICRECFITVANSGSNPGLKGAEQSHCCDPYLLERYKKARPYKNFSMTPRTA